MLLGPINNQTVKKIDSGNITINGDINGDSVVILVSTGGLITLNGQINGTSLVFLTTLTGSIVINGLINGSNTVVLNSLKDGVIVTGKVDGSSNVTIKAGGPVSIGTTGGDDDKKIDGSSSVTVRALGHIAVGSYIHASSADFSCRGLITFSGLDSNANVRMVAEGAIDVRGDINGSSQAELVSNRGTITLAGKVDGSSALTLFAGGDIRLGNDATRSDDDRKLAGDSFVSAIAGGAISLGGRIDNTNTTVDLAACGNVTIGQGIQGGSKVRLSTSTGVLSIGGPVTDSGTQLVFSTPTPFAPAVASGATAVAQEWIAPGPVCMGPSRIGFWWQNWSQSIGYVVDTKQRLVPRTLEELSAAVAGIGGGRVNEDPTPVKAIGGGWSFSDASLPFQNQADVDKVSTTIRGESGRQDLQYLLDVGDQIGTPMDLLPQAMGRNVGFSTTYSQPLLRNLTASGVQLPAATPEVRLIDTRQLASSLACDLPAIRANPFNAGPSVPREILFHVEAGITMADLQQLLDHQSPRLAIDASSGSPGATLAGVLSSSTHGGEVNSPVLVDTVRAIHLVGPGGIEWWIEGDIPVADPVKLKARYPKTNFIGGSWNGIPGLTAQDVLNAVVVSMGTMGVLYSVVLAVTPQFGIRQIVRPTTWTDLLAAAGVTEADLRANNAAKNRAILTHLADGAANGTGIPATSNVYIDLALNPINLDAWIVNRERTPALPIDSNPGSSGLGDWITAFRRAMSEHDDFGGDKLIGRIFDFFDWHTDAPGFFLNDLGSLFGLVSFITGSGDAPSTAAAVGAAQTVANVKNQAAYLDRGIEFVGDLLSAFFHALEGTAPAVNADTTGISHQVGAIGWPSGGLPGRGLEIALDSSSAFSFLQKVLIDDILPNQVIIGNKPLIGYISIRICKQTTSLMGMQQFGSQSVMIEVVAYRSPEANFVMDLIQERALAFNASPKKVLLHWGLENGKLTAAHLAGTPLGQLYKSGMTRLEAFRKVRDFFKAGHAPVFDNNFTARLGL